VQNGFHLQPFRRGSRVSWTDSRTDRTAVSNSVVYRRALTLFFVKNAAEKYLVGID